MRLRIFAVLLVLWGNAMQLLIGATASLPGGSPQFVAAGALVFALSLLAARWLGLDSATLGLTPSRALRGAVVGAAVAMAIAAVDVAVVQLAPAILGRPIVYEPLRGVSGPQLARHIAFFLPLGAIIPEEVAFRGTLLGALLRHYARREAVAWSALAFALWHVVVAVVTVGSTSLAATPLLTPAIIAALLILFVGGAIMAALRMATRSLATTIAAHYVFNVVILVGFFALQPAVGPTS